MSDIEPSQRTYNKYEAAERIWRLEKVIVQQDEEIRRLQSLLERAVSRGCNHCIEVIGPIRKELEPDLD